MIVGIDIGTSFSSICILNKEGKAEPVKVSTGLGMYGSDYSLPSAVFINNGQVQVGQAAFNSRMKAPENFKHEFKRDFGQEVPYQLGGRQWLPEDLYKELFIHLKYCAETYASDAIDMAYITHPTRFTDLQKKLLQQAAQKAGLLKTTFLAEPVAAAFHYVRENNLADNKTLLVYDFGGGTFDVALVRYLHGEFELISQPAGLDRCGGIDVDRVVFSHIMKAVPSELHQSVKENPKMLQNFKAVINEQSIKTKHHLSSSEVFHGEFPVGFDFVEFSLDHSSLNDMISHLVDETIHCVHTLLKSASFEADKIDEILLVGGSSRIPLVKTSLEKAFKRPIKENVNSELAIALGAAGYGKNNLSCGFLAAKERSGSYGFNDLTGKNVLPFIYEEAQNFSENRAAVKMNDKWGVIDQTGRIITPFIYDELYPFIQGLSRGRKGINWGLLNRTGSELTEFKYQMLGEFSEGLCPVKLRGLCGYLSLQGKEQIPLVYNHIEPFINGKALVKREAKFGYINIDGQELIPCQYEEIGKFINGRARIKRNNKTGFINAEGSEIIPCFFDDIGDFIDGLALVKVDNRYGFIRENGKAATRFIYHSASLFLAGRSNVTIENSKGVIDKEDNIIVPIQYSNISYDRPNLQFIAQQNKQTGTYSITGQILKPISKVAPKSGLIELAFVEGGKFKMGSNENGNEKPIHEVIVADYYIGKYPVTQEQWQDIMGKNPSHFKSIDHPVENISWLDAVDFCNRLSIKEGFDPVYQKKIRI